MNTMAAISTAAPVVTINADAFTSHHPVCVLVASGT